MPLQLPSGARGHYFSLRAHEEEVACGGGTLDSWSTKEGTIAGHYSRTEGGTPGLGGAAELGALPAPRPAEKTLCKSWCTHPTRASRHMQGRAPPALEAEGVVGGERRRCGYSCSRGGWRAPAAACAGNGAGAGAAAAAAALPWAAVALPLLAQTASS